MTTCDIATVWAAELSCLWELPTRLAMSSKLVNNIIVGSLTVAFYVAFAPSRGKRTRRLSKRVAAEKFICKLMLSAAQPLLIRT